MNFLILFALLAPQQYTRGIGIYPGNPQEYTGPTFRIDETTYRNLALHRPAYHSGAYDYNLTAQLVTDGIKHTNLPRWIATSTSVEGTLKKNEREWLVDGNWVSAVELPGESGWVQIHLAGGEQAPEIDRIDVDARLFAKGGEPENWTCTVSGSNDEQNWKELGSASGMARPGGLVKQSIPLTEPSRHRFYRIQFENRRAQSWQIGEVSFFHSSQKIHVGGPYNFTSAWMPVGQGEEWVYIDLGATCTFDKVVLHWIRRASEGTIQASDDAANWRNIQSLPATGEVNLDAPVKARYVRLLLKQPATPEGYVLSEMEVFGRGGPVSEPRPAPLLTASGRLDLAGGRWRLQRASQVDAAGDVLSDPGFADRDWLIATVPGTVLVSYHNAGALPDPNFGDNQLMISDSFFYSDFWYRNEFTAPSLANGQKLWLNFDGINWKAEVFLNGSKLGRIDGAFTRGRFDVTHLIKPGQQNALAVLVLKTATPGSIKEKTFEAPDKNGGVLGADNPAYHATIGWDWIPTIRGRDTGIWNDVYLTTSGPLTLEDPFVSTTLPLPDTSRAGVSIQVTVRNHEARPVAATLRGHFGTVPFETPVSVPASSTITLTPSLKLDKPQLWWPVGYGEPYLYDVDLRLETSDGNLSDSKHFQAGVRQFAYSEENDTLKMWINGRRFIPRGGNWGFGESMLRYRAREYDAAVRYHREQHFTMIRNWVGQIGDDEFYQACDRHGIVVWQDFWLANPWDGPDPDDNGMFLNNVRDTIKQIRNHASVGLYCGRNEGYPPAPVDRAIRVALAELHPGMHYISSSADDVVSGHGPYRRMPLKTYFEERATPKFHSEMGMPNIVTLDSLRAMMPEARMWPQGSMWGLHDFCLSGAQGGASFIETIEKSYGGADNAADWVSLAQFVNYEGYRAMFEAQSRNRMGLLIWMSHPAWPSLVWQTYDYFLEPTAAYFGARKGSEPLHIQWNPVAETVEVVNYNAGNATGLAAHAQVLNLDGSVKWEKTAAIGSAEDSTASVIQMEYPAGLTPVHFLRLELRRGNDVVSGNFYWRGTEYGDYRPLRQLPKVAIEAKTTTERKVDRWLLTTELFNSSQTPALMVKVKAIRETTRDRILPVIYSDNYIALMPGEKRTITTELMEADTRGEKPAIAVEGFNLRGN